MVSSDPYLAVYYPSSALTNDTNGNTVAVPMSHCVLRAIVKSDNSSFIWRAPAGSQRGVIDNATEIGYVDRASGRFITVGTTEGLRDLLYTNNVNPVAKFANRGLEIYGQKTRAADTSALDRINVSRLVAYLRNRLETLTKPFIFEPNDKITRNEVKQVIEQEMNELVATRGVYDYLVVCDESNNFPSRIDRNELWIDIAIKPTKSVEFIYIPVRILNTGDPLPT
jgi:phage tail sheath protein FI